MTLFSVQVHYYYGWIENDYIGDCESIKTVFLAPSKIAYVYKFNYT